MARYWRILSIAIGVTLATASSARSTTTDQTCTAARASAVQGVVSKPGPAESDTACTDTMSGTEKVLCLMLLGCMAVIGNQASRRKAIKAVAS